MCFSYEDCFLVSVSFMLPGSLGAVFRSLCRFGLRSPTSAVVCSGSRLPAGSPSAFPYSSLLCLRDPSSPGLLPLPTSARSLGPQYSQRKAVASEISSPSRGHGNSMQRLAVCAALPRTLGRLNAVAPSRLGSGPYSHPLLLGFCGFIFHLPLFCIFRRTFKG